MNEGSDSTPPSGAPPQRTTGGRVPWTPHAPEHMGRLLPQYDRWEMLGRGGMGAVYKARQTNLDRAVAIKILPPEAADDEAQFIERFKNEARTMAKLDHPAIVAVYDFGETSEGQLYFVMAYVDGTDVSKMIAEQGKLPAEHALAITAHVCDALQYAHAHGVIHRDIKPANVLLNREGQVKVADFGLAKMDDPANSIGLTKSGMSMGTPDFVAPESLVIGMVADHRADLYAVGVMLYQMLTGRIPRGMAKPPSQMVPGVDPRFDAIVDKAMEHDREQRWQSALEIRHALGQILTVPLVKEGDTVSSAAIPRQAAVPRPNVPRGNAPGAPGAPRAGVAVVATPKKLPLLPIVLGVVAVVGVIAFFALKPKPDTKRDASWSAVAERPAPAASATPLSPAPSQPKPASAPPALTTAKPTTPAVTPAPATKPTVAMETKPAPAAAAPTATPPPSVALDAPKAVSPAVPPSATALSRDGGTAAQKLPPELATLDVQFQKLQAERVTAPFEADVAKLNAGYLGGIAKKIAEEKAAGHLDGILALEAEQKVVTASSRQPSGGGRQDAVTTAAVPDTDDEKTLASLKVLRGIYREAHAKLAATRAANLKALTDPLDKRLAQMEADFTKADRLADAKLVRGYREALGSSGGILPPSVVPADGGRMPPPPVNPAAVLAMKDGITNTLGMKFLPVKGTEVLFCIHETRRQDYAAYAAEVPGVDGSWKNQQRDGIPCGGEDNHPVVGVSWEDAQKFCEWLSKKEGKTYRLPTDEEWSIAVGLGRLEKRPKGTTPEMLSGKETTEFPWGGDFPPKTKDKAGNYGDMTWHEKFPTQPWMEDYTDGFPTTAPVMSFKPNKLGLYDMGGNVWEWADDWWNAAQKDRVLRGASFLSLDRGYLLSSYRPHHTPGYRYNPYGFRCVMVVR